MVEAIAGERKRGIPILNVEEAGEGAGISRSSPLERCEWVLKEGY